MVNNPSNEDKINAQFEYLKTLQGDYQKETILVKAREGEIPEDKKTNGKSPKEYVKLYNWTPWNNAEPYVREHGIPMYTRGTLLNEIFIDPDNPDWQQMSIDMNKILNQCRIDNIPVWECAYSGGKGIHVSIIVDSFNVDDELKEQMKEYDIDFFKVLRFSLFEEIFRRAGVNYKDAMIDLKKVRFRMDRMGSQVRIYGATRPNGMFKTQIQTIPENKPVQPLPLMLPEGTPTRWNIENTDYKNIVIDAFKKACDHAEHVNEFSLDDADFKEIPISKFPCIDKIYHTNIQQGRYYATQAIILLTMKCGYERHVAEANARRFLNGLTNITETEKDIRINNAMDMIGKYNFSCAGVKDSLGDDFCNFKECPLKDLLKKAESKTLLDLINEIEPPTISYEKVNFAFEFVLKHMSSMSVVERDAVIRNELKNRMGYNGTDATNLIKSLNDHLKAQKQENNDNDNDEKEQLDETEFDTEHIAKCKLKAMDILKYGNPMSYMCECVKDIHIGDERAVEGLFLAMANQACLNTQGLQIKLSGDSGKGKSHVAKAVCHCLRDKHVIESSLSAKAAYYMDINPGMVLFSDDTDISEDMETCIKRATTNYQDYTQHTTVKDGDGKELTIPPRILWLITSVEDEVSDQLLNRQLVFNVDTTKEQDSKVFEMQIKEALDGEIRTLFVNDCVLICREMWDIIREKTHKIKIPFADDIEVVDKSNRRNFPMFIDMMKGYTVLNQFQRDVDPEDGKLISTKDDFYLAKSLFESQTDSVVSKLNEKERNIIHVIGQAGKEGIDINHIAKATELSYHVVRNALKGRNGKPGGLLEKVKKLKLIEESKSLTVEEEEGMRMTTSKKADKYILDDFNGWALFDNGFVFLKSDSNVK